MWSLVRVASVHRDPDEEYYTVNGVTDQSIHERQTTRSKLRLRAPDSSRATA